MAIPKEAPELVNGKPIDEVMKALAVPFDPKKVSFLPQSVDYKQKKAIAAAYADPRTYYERLDQVVGPQNWSSELSLITTPFNKYIKAKAAYGTRPATEEKQVPGNRVICIARVTIQGIGTKSSTGESDASDDNAATSAEAQATKRAISQFGPGKYFYALGKQSYPYDPNTGKWTVEPQLPAWAIPPIQCEKCSKEVTAHTFKRGNKDVTLSVTEVISNSEAKYQQRLCVACQIAKREENEAKNNTPFRTEV